MFDHYRLSPFNCAVIGKFLSSLLAQFTSTLPLVLSLQWCKIGDNGLEHFLQPVIFTMCSLARTTTQSKSFNELHLILGDNDLTHKSVEKLKQVLKLRSNPITLLYLSQNFNHSMTNKYTALKHLIECLSLKKCSLQFLSVGSSGFTEQHVYHLVLLLVHSHSLQELHLSFNSLSTGFSILCSGLKMNQCLTSLDLMGIPLSDDDILVLADALHQHAMLSTLGLFQSNSLHSPIFFQFLQKVFCVSSRSCLCIVVVDNRQYYPAMKQLESYQVHRQQNGLPQIYLEINILEQTAFSAAIAEIKATKNLEKGLLTGE